MRRMIIERNPPAHGPFVATASQIEERQREKLGGQLFSIYEGQGRGGGGGIVGNNSDCGGHERGFLQ
jgi:hypothetical protein